ncbi:unnamed protein product [Calypogeia fissa]
MVQAGERSRPESMSDQTAMATEQNLVSRLHHQRTMSADAAQPSNASEQQSVDLGGSAETRRTFLNHLSQLEVARVHDDEAHSWAMSNSMPEEGERGRGLLRIAQKLQYSRTMSKRLSPRSERMVASKIEELELSQLKSPQLRELVIRLKRMYSMETPKHDDSTDLCGRNPYSSFQLGERWEEIQGCSRWDGLLDPIDPVLRAEIVRYGEFAQAAYDAFDKDKTSKYCGSCKYTKEQLLERCGLENRGYEITQYLYATTDLDLPNFFTRSSRDDKWSKDSNWIGYVAVCTSPAEIARLGRRDILVAWRGTIMKFEWIKDIQDWLVPAGFDPRNGHKDVMVESGFLSVYKSSNARSRYNKKSAREQVLEAVSDLVEKYKHEKNKLSITVTGHSLGSALATLCGYDIAESKMNRLHGTSPIPHVWNSRKADWESTSPTLNSEDSRSVDSASNLASASAQTSNLDSSSTSAQTSNLGSSTTPAQTSNLGSSITSAQTSNLDSSKTTAASSLGSSTTSAASSSGSSTSSAAKTGTSSGSEGAGNLFKTATGTKLFPSDRIPVTIYSFAGPRVGNRAFRNRIEELGVEALRVTNKHDLVTKVPGMLFSTLMEVAHSLVTVVPTYKHIGVKLRVDNTASPYLQDPENPVHAHSLEGYLHVVDGFHGKKLPFTPTLRDYALVNKGGDYLKREFFIPAAWWQEAYKGLVRDTDGHWILPPRGEEMWPRSPMVEVEGENEQSPEVNKEEQFKDFWRSVSIAYERSTSTTAGYVSFAALEGAASASP